jgi:hypothetical protein
MPMPVLRSHKISRPQDDPTGTIMPAGILLGSMPMAA